MPSKSDSKPLPEQENTEVPDGAAGQEQVEPLSEEELARFVEALRLLGLGDLPAWYHGLEILLRLGSAVVPLLLERLDDATWTPQHYAILEALGRLGDEAAIPLLEGLLQHRDARRRLAVVRALRGLPTSAGPYLGLLRDPDWQVRQEAVFALGGLDSRRLVPPLVRCLRDPHHRVRAAAANALGRVDAVEAKDALRRALADEHRWVQSMAAWSLGRLGPQRDLAPLLTCLRDARKDAGVQLLQRAGLGDPDGTQACSALLELLEDPDEAVRAQTLEAIGRLQCVEAIPRLARMVRLASPGLRRKAAWALAAMGQPALAPLLDLLGHPDEAVQQCAIFALGHLRLRSAAEGVYHALLAESAYVREETKQSLQRLQGK